MAAGKPLFVAEGLSKSYTTPVLHDAHFELLAGQVHALVGENGAGKSTLARIVAGIIPPNSGTMRLNGEPYAPQNRAEAEHRGIRMVTQELNLVANLTVAESIFLDQLPQRFGWIDYPRLNRQAREALARIGLADLDPSRFIRTLGVGQKQLVEIAAGLSRQCDVFILDEPTAALTDPEIELLFTQIDRLKLQGVGLIYISHRMEEVKRMADRISILRDGRMVASRPNSEIEMDEIVRLMVGRELDQVLHREPATPGPVTLRACGLRRQPMVRDVSFEARQGQILGFAGLMGSGRTETMRLIFGADRPDGGEVFLHGSEFPAAIRSPREAVRQGIALLTEDRKDQGLLLPLTLRENITLTALKNVSRAAGWIERRTEQGIGSKWVKALQIRCHSSEQRVVELSGGNQQKVVLAKWLYRDCDILICDEPTRGIDVGAKFEIYQLLGDLARKGKTILLVSSDMKELLGLCDRIVVMSAGRVAATFRRGEWSQDLIMEAALSGYRSKAS